MITQCTKCQTKLNVPDEKIPPQGTKIKCPKCQNIFVVKKPTPAAPVQQPTQTTQPTQPKPPVQQTPSTQASSEFTIAQCDKCGVKSKIASAKIAPQGTKIKCPKCQNIFIVKKETAPAQVPTQVPTQQTKPVQQQPVATQQKQTPAKVEPPKQSSPINLTPQESEQKTAYSFPPPNFDEMTPEERKSHEDANRFARVLVSDIVMYNRDKIEEGLRNNTLTQLLGAEIKKSWQLYKQQVTPEITSTTNYFKDAINSIIGKGKKIVP